MKLTLEEKTQHLCGSWAHRWHWYRSMCTYCKYGGYGAPGSAAPCEACWPVLIIKEELDPWIGTGMSNTPRTPTN